MANSTIWWLVAGLVVGAELVTGTFYLLMLALGLAAAALAAHAGLSLTGQLVTAALVGGGAVAFWYAYRRRQPARQGAASNSDVNMDIGQTVVVSHWNEDNTATVQYRGAQWTVALTPGAARVTGPLRIKEVVGSRLIVQPD